MTLQSQKQALEEAQVYCSVTADADRNIAGKNGEGGNREDSFENWARTDKAW